MHLHIQAFTCTYTYMRTCMHTYMHACMHVCTCMHMHAHACTCMHMHACVHAYIHAYIHACMHACMHGPPEVRRYRYFPADKAEEERKLPKHADGQLNEELQAWQEAADHWRVHLLFGFWHEIYGLHTASGVACGLKVAAALAFPDEIPKHYSDSHFVSGGFAPKQHSLCTHTPGMPSHEDRPHLTLQHSNAKSFKPPKPKEHSNPENPQQC